MAVMAWIGCDAYAAEDGRDRKSGTVKGRCGSAARSVATSPRKRRGAVVAWIGCDAYAAEDGTGRKSATVKGRCGSAARSVGRRGESEGVAVVAWMGCDAVAGEGGRRGKSGTVKGRYESAGPGVPCRKITRKAGREALRKTGGKMGADGGQKDPSDVRRGAGT